MAVFKDYYIYVNGQMLFRGVQRDVAWTRQWQLQRPSLEPRRQARCISTPNADASQKQWGGPAEPSRCPPAAVSHLGPRRPAGLCHARGLGKEMWLQCEDVLG